MVTPSFSSGLWGWSVAALLLCTSALAAPRVGTHDGYTRLVFPLPSTTTQRSVLRGQTLTVTLGRAVPSEQGNPDAPGVTRYAVAGRVLTVQLAPGCTRATSRMLEASGGQPRRLVVDVPIPCARTPASVPAATVRPASTTSGTAPRPRVVLDPGHGGNDPGMASPWVREADVNLAVALLVREELVRNGVDVVMTRTTDRHLDPNKRTDLDKRARLASSGTVSAFVSIHTNAAGSSAQGIEAFYFGAPLEGQGRSTAVFENGGGAAGEALTRALSTGAQSMLGDLLAQAKRSFSRQLAQAVHASLVRATGAQSRGVKTDAFYVIRNPTTPAILVELGFGSHPVEGPKLAQASYQRTLAHALAQAVLGFLHRRP
ncbi:N-acetylmuramoyl-L-alanine amidase [Deinococcus metalli]|uniref:N-acetylmuramoyl-L-alanine amidase n=1 Tax=Deinococcus metalli TaxID=1141878 RepID=A0A7W8KHY3_9DEIO|nr:N-acetylmuramoyl-L-alanine amidase [Deinococcus metalli]MBB5378507.1 N-acetylmuramoyl-L-alanine amidase [Deinococcus metalli]GHF58206.1 N-acetylmuramoyl-L-alanine amidase [Deinococcus metalli]